jgi:tricorn protease
MFEKYFTGQLGKDGLIVDERYNHGGMVSAPGWAWWEPNDKGSGEWVVENHGVDPDYVVEQRPDLVLQGRDLQLGKAIELAKEGLKNLPPPLHRPPFPIKAQRPPAAQPGKRP